MMAFEAWLTEVGLISVYATLVKSLTFAARDFFETSDWPQGE